MEDNQDIAPMRGLKAMIRTVAHRFGIEISRYPRHVTQPDERSRPVVRSTAGLHHPEAALALPDKVKRSN